MIKLTGSRIASGSPLVIDLGEAPRSVAIHVAPAPSPASLASHLDFLWRFACRMGVGAATAEDIAHEAFMIALSRIETITDGKERAFLVSTVVRMVWRERQRRARHEELKDEPVAEARDAPDHALDDKRARELLDRSLDALEDDLRVVFVLHELEEETMANIAHLLDLAPGTVASRLRRAREDWKRATDRLRRERIR